MKKILAVLFILMLILTVFAACGRRTGNMIGTDSFPNLPNVSSKVNGTGSGIGTSSKEITSSEIENAWGDTSLDTGIGDGSSTTSNTSTNTSSSVTSSGNTSSGGTSGSTSSSNRPGSASSSTSSYDKYNSSNQGFNQYVPLK